jgi:hypothetical protein
MSKSENRREWVWVYALISLLGLGCLMMARDMENMKTQIQDLERRVSEISK